MTEPFAVVDGQFFTHAEWIEKLYQDVIHPFLREKGWSQHGSFWSKPGIACDDRAALKRELKELR